MNSPDRRLISPAVVVMIDKSDYQLHVERQMRYEGEVAVASTDNNETPEEVERAASREIPSENL